MWYLIPLMFFLAVGLDVLISWRNPPRASNEPKIYYPNLRVWGLGLLVGLGIVAAQLFGEATAKLNSEPALPGVLWPYLAPSVYIVAVLWLLVWGVVKLCRAE